MRTVQLQLGLLSLAGWNSRFLMVDTDTEFLIEPRVVSLEQPLTQGDLELGICGPILASVGC